MPACRRSALAAAVLLGDSKVLHSTTAPHLLASSATAESSVPGTPQPCSKALTWSRAGIAASSAPRADAAAAPQLELTASTKTPGLRWVDEQIGTGKEAKSGQMIRNALPLRVQGRLSACPADWHQLCRAGATTQGGWPAMAPSLTAATSAGSH